MSLRRSVVCCFHFFNTVFVRRRQETLVAASKSLEHAAAKTRHTANVPAAFFFRLTARTTRVTSATTFVVATTLLQISNAAALRTTRCVLLTYDSSRHSAKVVRVKVSRFLRVTRLIAKKEMSVVYGQSGRRCMLKQESPAPKSSSRRRVCPPRTKHEFHQRARQRRLVCARVTSFVLVPRRSSNQLAIPIHERKPRSVFVSRNGLHSKRLRSKFQITNPQRLGVQSRERQRRSPKRPGLAFQFVLPLQLMPRHLLGVRFGACSSRG